MIYNMGKQALNFFQNEGINKYPSAVVLACKLFLNTEGKHVGIEEKIKIGDDVYFNKNKTSPTQIILEDIRNDIISKYICFKETNKTEYNDILELYRDEYYLVMIKTNEIKIGTTYLNLQTILNPPNHTDIKRIFKTDTNPLIITSSGMYILDEQNVYKQLIQNNKISPSPSGSLIITGAIYVSNRFFISTNQGIIFSNITNLSTITSNTVLTWSLAKRISWYTEVGDGSGSGGVLENDNNMPNSFTNISYSGTNLKMYNNNVLYVSNITYFIQNFQNDVRLVEDSIIENFLFHKIVNGVLYQFTTQGLVNTITNQTLYESYPIKNYYKDNDIALAITQNNNLILHKDGLTPVVLTNTNGISSTNNYNLIINYLDENNIRRIICRHPSGTIEMIQKDETKIDIYSINFFIKEDYDKEKQNVKKIKYDLIDLYYMLYDQNSEQWKNILKVNNKNSNYIFIRLDKSNNNNSVWYFCGDDGRRYSEYKSVCKEFGIEP